MGGGIFAGTMALDSPNLEYFLERTRDTIDYVIVGKGEVFMLKALQGELPPGKRVFTAREFEEEIPRLPVPPSGMPDLSDLELQHYPYLAASASSGCPFKCKFCNSPVYYGEYTKKDIDRVVREMTQLHQQYGSRIFFMTDALLNPIIGDLSGEIIKNGTALYYDGYFRVDKETCNTADTLKWRRGGFYRARLGVESGSQRVLDLMDKGITVEQTKTAIASLAYAGIKATAYIVIGYPGETEEDFQLTLKLLEDIRNDVWQAECIPFAYYYNGQPGSDRWAEKRKLLYPPSAKELLITQTWVVDEEPRREEVYNRVFRFGRRCRELGIPNPYSLNEIYKADERWVKLQKNAVPPLVELMNQRGTDEYRESKEIKELQAARSGRRNEDVFAF